MDWNHHEIDRVTRTLTNLIGSAAAGRVKTRAGDKFGVDFMPATGETGFASVVGRGEKAAHAEYGTMTEGSEPWGVTTLMEMGSE